MNNSIIQAHQNIYNITKTNGINIYVWWWLAISFMVGKIHREHKDLDYIIDRHDVMKLRDLLLDYPEYIYKWITEKHSYKYIYDGVEIEFETVWSINTFVEQKIGKNPEISEEDIDFDNIYMIDWISWKCMKKTFFTKIRDVIWNPKYQIDKEILESI